MNASYSDVVGAYVISLVGTAVVGSLVGWWLVIVTGSLVAVGVLLNAAMPTIRFAWSKRQYRRARQREADEVQRREVAYQEWRDREAVRAAERRAAPKPPATTPAQHAPLRDVSAPREQQPAVLSRSQRRAVEMITDTMAAAGTRVIATRAVTARHGITGKQLATALRGTGIAPQQLGIKVLSRNLRGYTAASIEAVTGEAVASTDDLAATDGR